MKLPSSDRARIPRRKLVEYLLSETHSVGRAKSGFFRSHGYDDTNIPRLERGLLRIARTHDVKESTSSPFGTKYVVDGPLDAPSGSRVTVRTVWIIESGEDAPRFVTAFPA